MIRTRHEFLAALHEVLQPTTYLEIGVQFGHSLRLSLPTTKAIGIDPDPLCAPPPNAQLFSMTSDRFFAIMDATERIANNGIDFAFIDGMHLVENALRDFINVETYCHPGSVVALDDVLPYSPDIAHREPLPGDWAGDVWKLWPILTKWRPDLKITMVDVEPTGLMILQRLDPGNGPQLLNAYYDSIVDTWAREVNAADWLNAGALKPVQALQEIERTMNGA